MLLPTIITHQDVLNALDQAPLSDARRVELRRDVRKAGRILCPTGPLDQIIVTSRAFRGQLEGITAHAIGCKTQKRRDNLVSNSAGRSRARSQS